MLDMRDARSDGSPSCRLVTRRPRRSRRGRSRSVWGSTSWRGAACIRSATADGFDAWRVGPLDPADETRLAALTEWFPPRGPCDPRAPTRACCGSSTPASLIRESWDAIADVLVRTPPRRSSCRRPRGRHWRATDVSGAGAWLDSLDGSDGDSARPGLRLELGPGGATARAVVQLRSRVDPSLVVDADELWDAPAVGAGPARRAGRDRPAARAAPRRPRPGRRSHAALDDARPVVLDLDEDETAELLGPAAEALAAAGFEVLWPAELTRSQPRAARGRALADPGARERRGGRPRPRRALRVPLAGDARRRRRSPRPSSTRWPRRSVRSCGCAGAGSSPIRRSSNGCADAPVACAPPTRSPPRSRER